MSPQLDSSFPSLLSESIEQVSSCVCPLTHEGRLGCSYEHPCAGFCVGKFQLLWVNTKEHNRWTSWQECLVPRGTPSCPPERQPHVHPTSDGGASVAPQPHQPAVLLGSRRGAPEVQAAPPCQVM